MVSIPSITHTGALISHVCVCCDVLWHQHKQPQSEREPKGLFSLSGYKTRGRLWCLLCLRLSLQSELGGYPRGYKCQNGGWRFGVIFSLYRMINCFCINILAFVWSAIKRLISDAPKRPLLDDRSSFRHTSMCCE